MAEVANQIIIGRYSCREQAVVGRELARTRGEGWARDLTRDEYRAAVYAALAERYGTR